MSQFIKLLQKSKFQKQFGAGAIVLALIAFVLLFSLPKGSAHSRAVAERLGLKTVSPETLGAIAALDSRLTDFDSFLDAELVKVSTVEPVAEESVVLAEDSDEAALIIAEPVYAKSSELVSAPLYSEDSAPLSTDSTEETVSSTVPTSDSDADAIASLVASYELQQLKLAAAAEDLKSITDETQRAAAIVDWNSNHDRIMEKLYTVLVEMSDNSDDIAPVMEDIRMQFKTEDTVTSDDGRG